MSTSRWARRGGGLTDAMARWAAPIVTNQAQCFRSAGFARLFGVFPQRAAMRVLAEARARNTLCVLAWRPMSNRSAHLADPALIRAVKEDDIEEVKKIIALGIADPSGADALGNTGRPLRLVVSRAHLSSETPRRQLSCAVDDRQLTRAVDDSTALCCQRRSQANPAAAIGCGNREVGMLGTLLLATLTLRNVL